MKIAVLGANGRLAHAVARAFLKHGHRVVAVTRNGRCEGLSGDVEYRAADAMKEADLIAATKGVDMIFNGLNPPYDKWDKFVMPMARNVMAAAEANKVVHLFIGNVYNYGKEIPVNANEETPFHATTEKAVTRIEMEALFKRYADEHGVKTVVLRAGDFYGTEKAGSWFDMFIANKVQNGVFTWPGPMNLPHAFAYLPDLADTFVRLAGHEAELPLFSTFNFPGHTLTGEQFGSILEKISGQKLKRKTVPWLMFRLLGTVYPIAREAVKMNYLWFTAHSLSGKRLEALLGEVPATAPEDAIQQAMIDQGFLDKIRLAA